MNHIIPILVYEGINKAAAVYKIAVMKSLTGIKEVLVFLQLPDIAKFLQLCPKLRAHDNFMFNSNCGFENMLTTSVKQKKAFFGSFG